MTVSDLIKLLQKCEQDAHVEFAYKSDETTSGTLIESVIQIVFFGDGEVEPFATVQLRGM